MGPRGPGGPPGKNGDDVSNLKEIFFIALLFRSVFYRLVNNDGCFYPWSNKRASPANLDALVSVEVLAPR